MAVIYLFTEGADGCSQVQFWKLINTFVFQDKLRIVPCNGVSNVLKEIEKREICEDAQQRIDPDSDILLLDIDYVDDNQRLENILMDIIEYSDTRIVLGICCSENQKFPVHIRVINPILIIGKLYGFQVSTDRLL